MEGQLDQWMAEFHTYLALPDNPVLAESDPEKESVLDAVRSAACQNINLVGRGKGIKLRNGKWRWVGEFVLAMLSAKSVLCLHCRICCAACACQIVCKKVLHISTVG